MHRLLTGLSQEIPGMVDETATLKSLIGQWNAFHHRNSQDQRSLQSEFLNLKNRRQSL